MSDSLIYWHAFAHWKLMPRVSLCKGVTYEQIKNFETTNNVKLPADMKIFYMLINGFSQEYGYEDDNSFNVWPLEKMQPMTEFEDGRFSIPNCPTCFIFSDHLDFSWGYAISLSPISDESNFVFIIGTANGIPQKIAESFIGFLSLLIEDNPLLYPK